MTVTIPRWRGIYAVMLTPFQKDLSLDEGGLRTNARFLAEQPVDVVIALGSEGEFYALTDAERRRVAEITVDELAGKRPVVVGVSHPSAVGALALAKHAAAIGADAVLSTPPYFGQPAQDDVRRHFGTIAEAGLPVFAYNSPGRVGYNLRPADIAAILGLPGIVGVKQAAADITELVDLLCTIDPDGPLVVGGAEKTIWPAFAVGATGNTATAASAIPDAFARLWRLAQDGCFAEGRDLYASLAPLREAYALAGGQAPVVKRLLDRVGLCGGPVRPPARDADAAVDRALESLITELEAQGLWRS